MIILRDEQLDVIDAVMMEDRHEELKIRLNARGKLGDMEAAAVMARIDHTFARAAELNMHCVHEVARLVEFFFLLSPAARASATCGAVVDALLDKTFIPCEDRVDFLYRHVLTRTDWPD
jgi:hypothetical protein